MKTYKGNMTPFFQKNLIYYRKLQGYSQEDLGMLIGVDRSYISKLEKGRANPTLRVIFTIAEVLEIEPCLLLVKPGSICYD